jgi:hypothetical protein
MNVFKFTPITSPTFLEQGQMIPKPDSIMWTERYRDPGEFEIVAPLSSGMKEFLPEGTIISHVDTMEVMIVENHEISEEPMEDPIVTVTGRSFESFLDNRIVGTDQARASSTIVPYELFGNSTWHQTVAMINSHIVDPFGDYDGIPYVVAEHSIVDPVTTTTEERTIDRGGLHQRALEILAVDDLGIKTIRRSPFPEYGGDDTNTTLQVHNGINRINDVVFSWRKGDIESAEYLFSAKKLKNSALIQGRYVQTFVDLGPTRYNRRTMIVDADDIDGHFDAAPTGTALALALVAMQTRGRQVLKSQKRVTITQADVSNMAQFQYRKDYNIGDMVTVEGNFGQTQAMRVIEFAEIEDENGRSAHPTLSVPDADETEVA